MNKKTQYPSRIYINGVQIGDNATFSDWHESDEEAIAEARAIMEEHYSGNIEITIESLPRWAHTPPQPTLVIKVTSKGKCQKCGGHLLLVEKADDMVWICDELNCDFELVDNDNNL